MNLERKVCDAYERRELNKRKQNKSSSKRIDSPKPGPSNLSYTNKRTTGDRSLVTPPKQNSHTGNDDEYGDSIKRRRTTRSNKFFFNLIKSSAGHRESKSNRNEIEL